MGEARVERQSGGNNIRDTEGHQCIVIDIPGVLGISRVPGATLTVDALAANAAKSPGSSPIPADGSAKASLFQRTRRTLLQGRTNMTGPQMHCQGRG